MRLVKVVRILKSYLKTQFETRNANGQTKSGLYSLFIPMEWNMEGFIDRYGMPVFRAPDKKIKRSG